MSLPPSPGPAPAPTPAPGPVRPGDRAQVALRPAESARVTGGFWHERRRVNAEVSIPEGPALLDSAGNLHNLRLAARTATGEYRGELPFLDTDVTKWLEAACWQLAETDWKEDFAQAEDVDRIIRLLADAQQDDGYLQSYYQVVRPGLRFVELRWGHELYCAGHLIQAAVAHHRATGREDLLTVARRFADHIDDTFGPGRPVDGICGHAEIETALVELYRETGERRYLDLAGYFIDRHGHGLLNEGDAHGVAPGPAYCQDHVPVREAETVTGHAVRQLYLLAGATDVAAETGEPELRAAMERLWEAMTTTKTHLTGGLGAHHAWEDFGDPYELPNERAYCETCSAIASVQWSWRMALLTGEARYSDLIERTLFNGFLAGVSLDGLRWLYVNPLQVRDGYEYHGGDNGSRRALWFTCACCPPNVMRLLASLPHYLASTDTDGLQLHQYATGSYGGLTDGGRVAVGVDTDYPWQGRIAVTVDEAGPGEWTLSLRVPQWCEQYTLEIGATPAEQVPEDGWLRIRRTWRPGDTVVLNLGMEPRLTRADPRVDAVRDCVAVERGPLVHCLEQVDQPGAPGLDDIVLDPTTGLTVKHRPDLLGGVTTVVGSGRLRARPAGQGWWPYRTTRDTGRDGADTPADTPVELTAIPYYAWANRENGGMRVWLPTS
ncbi:glycoside hydrolase family 127 protein [Streptomyces prunicolor]|uniref:glycoside hydrolase family 127 protein n=1 Tax=Streptomyces prunicolor TaxID=67348 RepID=UPI0003A418DE|nr:beta-L-arabinofuranosidase domain-containing protein [Streptomyces prunicolor]